MTEEEIKQSYMDKYYEIVSPKNLTREQEMKLIEKIIKHQRFLLKEYNTPCIEGHKHSDSLTRYDNESPWVCVSCGKEFPTWRQIWSMNIDLDGNIITEENSND
jgi:hypothetical protein